MALPGGSYSNRAAVQLSLPAARTSGRSEVSQPEGAAPDLMTARPEPLGQEEARVERGYGLAAQHLCDSFPYRRGELEAVAAEAGHDDQAGGRKCPPNQSL